MFPIYWFEISSLHLNTPSAQNVTIEPSTFFQNDSQSNFLTFFMSRKYVGMMVPTLGSFTYNMYFHYTTHNKTTKTQIASYTADSLQQSFVLVGNSTILGTYWGSDCFNEVILKKIKLMCPIQKAHIGRM